MVDDMNMLAFSSILVFLSSSVMSVLAFVKCKNREIGRVLGILTFLIVIWGVGIYMLATVKDISEAYLWRRIANIPVIFCPILYYHLVFVLLKLRENYQRFILHLVYSIGFILLILNLFFPKEIFSGELRYVFNEFFYTDWRVYKSPIYLLFYVGFYWIFLPYIMFVILKYYKRATGIFRNQLKYFIIGSFIAWLGPIFMWLIEFGVDIYPYTNFCIAVYPPIWVYAFVRYRLLDINIVIQKGFVYSVLATVITGGYFLFVIGIEKIFRGVVGYQSFVANLGAIFIIAILFNPLRDGIQRFLDKRFFHGTLDSLARERQRLQQELYQAQKLAYVGQLASSIVHEVRNPLTSIQTYLKYLPEKYHDPEFKRKFFSLVPREVERIEKVVNQLLDLGKPGQRKIANVNICSLIDSTLCLIEDHIKLKNISVKKHFDNEEIFVQADEEQLRQVFLNLFLNAIQAMEDAGELGVSVFLPAGDGSRIKIEITDNGCGMAEETRKKIFTPFFTTKKDGVGLGLVIIQEIIKEHNGSITVESKLNKGTRFSIELPA